jgi:spermidine/putrescine-binding protein
MADAEKESQPNATADDVRAAIERTHAAVTAAITVGYANVEDAMKSAEAAVAQAVNGVAQALELARNATKS